jgi:hypothetical protein
MNHSPRVSARTPTFPSETFDEIIDHLHPDKAALATCALVCRSWLPSSRYHLFAEVNIVLENGDNVARFLQLLAFPKSIAPFIRKVNVLDGTYKELVLLYEALAILRDTTPGYHSISFDRMPLYPSNLHDVLPLGRLTEFSASLCVCKSFRDLIALFFAMPYLQRLELHGVFQNTPISIPTIVPGTILLSRLYALNVHSCHGASILSLLAPPPALRELVFNVQTMDDMLRVGAFLRPLASCLEIFKLIIYREGGLLSRSCPHSVLIHRPRHRT